jgi:hypothetical protein|tara:strand:+ start:157 stop:297 length:141 start_codon:yes stop_codon:yes gene_type:complete
MAAGGAAPSFLAQFEVKDLDSGKSFAVSEVEEFLGDTKINTFSNTI